MVSVAVLLGADKEVAQRELKESLLFEIELAEASQARENRRNATRMYNPMLIKDLHTLAPMVPWLEYINNILTEDLLQVDENERVIVDEPGYFRNLTKEARKIQLEFAKNITGTKTETPRWKSCTG